MKDCILFVRNLPFQISDKELYVLFGQFGAIHQIRKGNADNTKGTAFVVFEEPEYAKKACENLSGFNIKGRYIIVVPHQPEKQQSRTNKYKQVETFEKEEQVPLEPPPGY